MLQTKDTQAKKTLSMPRRPTAGQQPKASDPSAAPAKQDIPRGAISPEERQRMIAEAAYFRAQQRGFAGGDPLDDWLAAEQEINQTLSSEEAPKGQRAAS